MARYIPESHLRDLSLIRWGGGGAVQIGKITGLKLFVPSHVTTGLYGNILMYTVDS